MMKNHLTDAVNTKVTPQTEVVPGMETVQVQNNAGGYVFGITPMQRLRRFLVLGSENGTFYQAERDLTKQNVAILAACLKADWKLTIDEVVKVNVENLAPKVDSTIFALAYCASNKNSNAEARHYALDQLPVVCRTGTHLFNFVEYYRACCNNKGSNRAFKRAVAGWYLNRAPEKLALQLTKYQQRGGWSHKDLLRLSHPQTEESVRNDLFKWAINGWETIGEHAPEVPALVLPWCTEKAKTATEKEVVELVRAHGIPWELIPSEKQSKEAYELQIETAGLTWLIRNLGNLSKSGVLVDGKFDVIKKVCDRITNMEDLRSARVHPFNILIALTTYQQGHGMRGNSTWTPVSKVCDALNQAFYLAFGNITPSNKRILVALDVSSSMNVTINNMPGMTARSASAAMASIYAGTEDRVTFMAFSTNFVPFEIRKNEPLDSINRKMNALAFGGTDCALPMQYARGMSTENAFGNRNANRKKISELKEYDAFVIFTDSETWYGGIHPFQALQAYRKESGIPAQLVVHAMTATGFSIADPNDIGMLDLCGLDSSSPEIMGSFLRGELGTPSQSR